MGEYIKLKVKKIGPCRILRKFLANAYELELLEDVGTPIFNVTDLHHFHADEASDTTEATKEEQQIQWKKQLPTTRPLVPQNILDEMVRKKTRDKEYFEYLIKWRDHLVEDSTWMTATMLQKNGSTLEDLMDKSP